MIIKDKLKKTIWFIILIYPIFAYIGKYKTNINQIALYYVGWFLLFTFGKIILGVISLLALFLIIFMFFQGHGIEAIKTIGIMLVFNTVGFILLDD